jgi:hypothetical protein
VSRITLRILFHVLPIDRERKRVFSYRYSHCTVNCYPLCYGMAFGVHFSCTYLQAFFYYMRVGCPFSWFSEHQLLPKVDSSHGKGVIRLRVSNVDVVYAE